MGHHRFIGWMVDIAREQRPGCERLGDWIDRSAAAGYNAVGLYLEHRFAYASAPHSTPDGAVTPEDVQALSSRYRDRGLRIIPFLNTLGHMEGFIRHPEGVWLAEGPDAGGSLQMCPSWAECRDFARSLVADAIDAFTDEWVHLGGDETRQLGTCPRCAERAGEIGVGGLYGAYFGELCRWVLARGRRPCLWGDMLLQHHDALDAIPRETVIFDWQYTHRPAESTRFFRERGFDVVCCPSVQTYNGGWCFLRETQQNIEEHADDARELGALGVLVTSWEFSYLTNYASTLPIILSAGRRLAHGTPWRDALVAESDEAYADAAEILGNVIPAASSFLAPGTWRQLRDRLVMRRNPFWLWKEWRDEACGPAGDEILRLCGQAEAMAGTESPLAFPIELHRVAVEFVRAVEAAARAFETGATGATIVALEHAADAIARLRPGLVRIAADGGAAADVERLDRLVSVVHAAAERCGSNESRPAPFAALLGVEGEPPPPSFLA